MPPQGGGDGRCLMLVARTGSELNFTCGFFSQAGAGLISSFAATTYAECSFDNVFFFPIEVLESRAHTHTAETAKKSTPPAHDY